MPSWLLVALFILTCFAADTGIALASSPAEVGIAYSGYTYPNCTSEHVVDPINVVWEGGSPTPGKVAHVLYTHGWTHNDYRSPIIKFAEFLHLGHVDTQYVHETGGNCWPDSTQAATGNPFGNRNHVRLFATGTSEGIYVVGDAHHDQVETAMCGEYVCNNCVQAIIGGHITSSFNQGREAIKSIWPSTSRFVDWGNNYAITQCNGEKKHSDGKVLFMNANIAGMSSYDPENTSEPTISGTPRVGSTLTAHPGTWTGNPTSFAYEWCVLEPEYDECSPYPGATGSTWTPQGDISGEVVGVMVRPSSAPASDAVLSNVVEVSPPLEPPPAPSVVPLAATEMTASTARLNANVNPNGSDTHYYFEWDTREYLLGYPPHGTQIPAGSGMDLGSGMGGIYCWNRIEGLAPGTTYHFRLVAVSSAGTTYGPDETFTTLLPPYVEILPPTEITPTHAVLNVRINPSGFDTQYYFEYGTTAEYDSAVPVLPSDIGSERALNQYSNLAENLEPATVYHYRIVASSSQGTSASQDKTFRTPAPPVVEPETPRITSPRHASLDGLINPEEAKTHYHFEWDTRPYEAGEAPHGTVVPVPDQTLGNTQPSFWGASTEIGGLYGRTTYYYRLVATNEWGTTYGVGEQLSTPPWEPGVTPEPATNIAGGKAILHAKVDAKGFDTHYHFQWGATTAYGHTAPVEGEGDAGSGEGVEIAQTISGVQEKTLYHYRLVATSYEGTTYGEDQTFMQREWLASGTPVRSGEMAIESEAPVNAPVLFEEQGSGLQFQCSYREEGKIKAEAGGEITSVTGLSGESAVRCSVLRATATCSESSVEMSARNLPWRTELITWNGQPRYRITSGGSGLRPEWIINCTGTRGKVEEYCSAEVNSEPTNVTAGLESIDDSSSNSTGCVVNSGLNIRGKELIRLKSGQELAGTRLPTAETREAAVTEGCTTLNGAVNSQEELATYHFEYGETNAYGKSVPVPDAPVPGVHPGEAPAMPVSNAVPNLSPSTKYHFRVVATNAYGTAYGPDRTFTTFTTSACGKPGVTTEPASFVNSLQPQLNATVNPDGADTKYHFEYDTKEYKAEEGPHGTNIPATAEDLGSGHQAIAVGKSPSGLARNTTYHYRVVAENEFGTSYGQDQSFTTLPLCKGAEGNCTWSLTSPANPAPLNEASLGGVSCDPTGNCYAVGYDKYKGRGFTEVWSGGAWTLMETRPGEELKAISCYAANLCMAVGAKEGSIRYLKLEYGLTKGSGTPALPASATNLSLNSVSCSSSSACTGVGSYYFENKEWKALVERWNGTAWSLQTAPNPAEGTAQSAMLSVSCSSASSCVTTGEAASKPTAETWNGTAWSLATPLNPTGATTAKLESVSCSSSSSCAAVGNFKESTGYKKPLAESWNGSAWSVQSVPQPSGAVGDAKLRGVSCLSASSCFAVGNYVAAESGRAESTLAASWNGAAWTLQSTPNPEKTNFSTLAGISCASSVSCTAVGGAYPSSLSGESVALGERYE